LMLSSWLYKSKLINQSIPTNKCSIAQVISLPERIVVNLQYQC